MDCIAVPRCPVCGCAGFLMRTPWWFCQDVECESMFQDPRYPAADFPTPEEPPC